MIVENKATQVQIRQFYTLLGQLNLKAQKESLLVGYDVESTKDLTEAQIKDLIGRLLNIQQGKATEALPSVRKQRSIMLALLTDMGIYTDKSSWSDVNALLLNPRIAGKVMYEMDEAELKGAIGRIRAMKAKQPHLNPPLTGGL